MEQACGTNFQTEQRRQVAEGTVEAGVEWGKGRMGEFTGRDA